MTGHTTRIAMQLLILTSAIFVVPVIAQSPDSVSPGVMDRIAEIEGRCPTFSWSPMPGAMFHELVGYRLPGQVDVLDLASVDLSGAEQVLYSRVPGGASAWEPELADCLVAGGSYVWFVRAVYLEEEGEVLEASEWSSGRYFSISTMPSLAEVEEALRVLRRFAEYENVPEAVGTERAEVERPAPSERLPASYLGRKSVTAAKTAIKGNVGDASGETYGVVGISNSPNGAGLAAGNTGGGADLVLDGLEDGDLDTVFTQAGIDRTSDSEEWFFLLNSGDGVLSLNVEGQIVGSGAGLTAVNADTLDGTEGSAFATDVEAAGLITAHAASTDHDGRYFTETELDTSGGGGSVHWDNLTTVPAGLADGDDDTLSVMPGTGWGLYSATTVDNAESVGDWNSIAIGSDGLPIVSYFDKSNYDLKVAHCSDLACTSAEIATVDSEDEVGLFTSITTGTDGLPIISYCDWTNRDLKVAHCLDLGCSTATLTTVDSTGLVGRLTSITIGADGLPVISYSKDGDGLNVAHCSDSACTSATITNFNAGIMVEYPTSVAVGTDSLPVVSYHDLTNWDLKVAHCSNTVCTAATITTVDSGGDVGAGSSITIGSDGLPVVSYYDSSNTSLKVAHCSNTACTSATIAVIDTGLTSGLSSSITIGSDGLPVIAYWDSTNGDLKVAHCSDSACASAVTTTVVKSGDVFAPVSLTVGADGLPLVTYYDDTDENLEVVHCANVFCIPYTRRR